MRRADDTSDPALRKASGPSPAMPARASGFVPHDGARIWFQFQAYGNGPTPQIVYFNGRRVALGDDLEPIVLFDSADEAAK